MRQGYTYIDVKPTIPAVTQQGSSGIFFPSDVLFDWTEVRIPAGVGRLVGLSAFVRGNHGITFLARLPFDIYFSKSDTFSLAGTVSPASNSPVDLQPNNDLLGAVSVTSGSYMNSQNHMAVANVVTSARVTVPSTQITRNEHRIYVGGVVGIYQAMFKSGSLADAVIDVSGLSAATFTTLDGTDLTSVFGPGDIVHAYNPVATTSVICGEVTTLDANNISFRHDGAIQESNGGLTLYTAPDDFAAWQVQNGAGSAGDLEDNAELINIHPITLKLSFAYTD